tara:strand:+ start:60 stop:275 length:216 start_codon:yes stop_codon:yes gene_type:complete
MEDKIYIDNSRFMELIDELATDITQMNFGLDTYLFGTESFTEEAQDYYNEKYDEYEGLLNNITKIYSNAGQ